MPQLLLNIDRCVDDGVPAFEDIIRHLIDRRQLKMRQVGGDKIAPILARGGLVHGFRHGDHALGKAEFFEYALERTVGYKYRLVPRSRKRWAMPTQFIDGPKVASGKNTMVLLST